MEEATGHKDHTSTTSAMPGDAAGRDVRCPGGWHGHQCQQAWPGGPGRNRGSTGKVVGERT